VILLGIPGLPETHIAYPVIVQTKRFGRALRIDASAGSTFFDAARHLQPMRSSLYRSDKLPGYALGIGVVYERERRMKEAMDSEEIFFVTFVPFFVSVIA